MDRCLFDMSGCALGESSEHNKHDRGESYSSVVGGERLKIGEIIDDRQSDVQRLQ